MGNVHRYTPNERCAELRGETRAHTTRQITFSHVYVRAHYIILFVHSCTLGYIYTYLQLLYIYDAAHAVVDNKAHVIRRFHINTAQC